MPESFEENKKKVHLIAVNMGYGHQRTAFPLKNLALDGKIINANDYEGIPKKDRAVWEGSRGFYEFISRFKGFPLLGELAFAMLDKFQQIPDFYPHRDLSRPNFSSRLVHSAIKRGWGRDLMNKLQITNHKLQKNLPIVSTFFTPAFMAEAFGYPGDIYCVICDADVSRSWAPYSPKKSRIKYFAPNSWTVERLKLYGVRPENIFLTGYPLPTEIIGTEYLEVLKNNLSYRLLNIDPEKKYFSDYKPLVERYLGQLPEKPNHIFTILFSIGGAGAQSEVVRQYLVSLSEKIKTSQMRVILSAGIKQDVRDYFLKIIKKIGLSEHLDKNIEIIFQKNIEDYFREFNQKLMQTDILWTKPSELSFYCGLGLPVIIAQPIGSQEYFNRKWLLRLGSGMMQENPREAVQWIFDYLKSGRFAQAAMQGFVEVEKQGVYNIQKICFGKN